MLPTQITKETLYFTYLLQNLLLIITCLALFQREEMKASTESAYYLHRIMSSSSYNEEDLPSFSRYSQLKQYELAKKIGTQNENYVGAKHGHLK